MFKNRQRTYYVVKVIMEIKNGVTWKREKLKDRNNISSSNSSSEMLENTEMLNWVAKVPTQIDRTQLKKEV